MNNKLKRLCILSILLATNVAVSAIKIPVSTNLEVSFTFLITMYVAANFKVPECVIFVTIEDLMTYFLFEASRWPFFPGYTLSAIIGILIFYFFLHKKVSLLNVALSKTLVNIFVNVCLGSIWSKMMYGNAFLYYATTSLIKNLVLLPFEIIIFYIIYKALNSITKKYLSK